LVDSWNEEEEEEGRREGRKEGRKEGRSCSGILMMLLNVA
jgi:predicted transposase YdaD